MTRFSGVMGVNLKKLNQIILFLNARLHDFRIQCFQGYLHAKMASTLHAAGPSVSLYKIDQ